MPKKVSAAQDEAMRALARYGISDQDAQKCCACDHFGLRHGVAGCTVGRNGQPHRDNTYPSRSHASLVDAGEICWCPRFVNDVEQGRLLRLKLADLATVQREAVSAVEASDSILAQQALDWYIKRSLHATRDNGLVATLQRDIADLLRQKTSASIAALRSTGGVSKDRQSSADSLEQQARCSPESGGAGTLTWEGIEISFLSDERVQIRINGEATGTVNYAEFGFADQRNGLPNKAWVLLRTMAENSGIINSTSKNQKWPNVEKRIQEIRKVLRGYFDKSSDPIPFVSAVGYQTRFKIGCGPSFPT